MLDSLNKYDISNIDLENITKAEKFDLNEHLYNFLYKLNFDDKGLNKEKYCLNCKLFFDLESIEDHSSHDVIENTKDLKNLDYISDVFDNLETKHFDSFLHEINSQNISQENLIQNSTDKVIGLLNDFRVSKKIDLENLRDNHKKNFDNLKRNFFELKYKFSNFYKKNDFFLNINTTGNTNCNNQANNNLNNSVSGININNNLNNTFSGNQLASNLTASSSNVLNIKNQKNFFKNPKDKLVNDVFFLVNYDLNRQIELSEKRLDNYLESEKNKVISQASEIEKIFNDFSNQIINFNEKKFQNNNLNNISNLNNTKTTNLDTNKFPDFTQSLNIRLKKYSDIMENLNTSLLDIKNSITYKKIETKVGNLEKEMMFKMSNKNPENFNKTNDKIFPCFNDDLDINNSKDLQNPEFYNYETKEINFNKSLDPKNIKNITNSTKAEQILKRKIDFSKISLLQETELNQIEENKNNSNNPIMNRGNLGSKSIENLAAYNSDNLKNKCKSDCKEIPENDSDKKHLQNSTFSLNEKNTGRKKRDSFHDKDKSNILQNETKDLLNLTNLHRENTSCIINHSTLLNKTAVVKIRDELIKKFLILSLMGTVEDIQELEEEAENSVDSKCEKILRESCYFDNFQEPIFAKIIENTNEILIYDRKLFSITKHKINLNKDLHGIQNFLDGSRCLMANDRVYITGGRDLNQQYTIFLEYDYKTNLLRKMPNMKAPRAYHTFIFNSPLMKLYTVGGENNKTCEEYDFYKEKWVDLPDLNIARAYINCYVNTSNKMIYAFFGEKGEITKNNFTDTVEILNLEKKELGWIKVEYSNKSDIDLKNRCVRVFPIESDKLLIVGNCITRYNHQNFAVYDLKIDNISKLDSRMMMVIKKKSKDNFIFKKLLSQINKSLK